MHYAFLYLFLVLAYFVLGKYTLSSFYNLRYVLMYKETHYQRYVMTGDDCTFRLSLTPFSVLKPCFNAFGRTLIILQSRFTFSLRDLVFWFYFNEYTACYI